jgi:hypothetical protein
MSRTPSESSWVSGHLRLGVEIHRADTAFVLSRQRSGIRLDPPPSTTLSTGESAGGVSAAAGQAATKDVDGDEKLLTGKMTHPAAVAAAGLLAIWWLWELGEASAARAVVAAGVISAMCGLAAFTVWMQGPLPDAASPKVPAASHSTVHRILPNLSQFLD